MTSEMLDKARANCKKGNYSNVEFRLGEIENLPVADATGNVIISNCVINLSPNKQRVFQEAYRILKPQGRLMISDMALLKELPEKIKSNISAYVGCIAGAETKERYLDMVKQAGFQNIQVVDEYPLPEAMLNEPDVKELIDELGLTKKGISDLAKSVVSMKVSAVKP
jgi:ubiquinone/menaquinone biosynthesis C-methylase UbiE